MEMAQIRYALTAARLLNFTRAARECNVSQPALTNAIKSLEALRGVCSHVGSVVLPGPVSVAGVQKVFDQDGNCLDERVESRIRGVATGLLHYISDNICPRMALESMVRE